MLEIACPNTASAQFARWAFRLQFRSISTRICSSSKGQQAWHFDLFRQLRFARVYLLKATWKQAKHETATGSTAKPHSDPSQLVFLVRHIPFIWIFVCQCLSFWFDSVYAIKIVRRVSWIFFARFRSHLHHLKSNDTIKKKLLSVLRAY